MRRRRAPVRIRHIQPATRGRRSVTAASCGGTGSTAPTSVPPGTRGSGSVSPARSRAMPAWEPRARCAHRRADAQLRRGGSSGRQTATYTVSRHQRSRAVRDPVSGAFTRLLPTPDAASTSSGMVIVARLMERAHRNLTSGAKRRACRACARPASRHLHTHVRARGPSGAGRARSGAPRDRGGRRQRRVRRRRFRGLRT